MSAPADPPAAVTSLPVACLSDWLAQSHDLIALSDSAGKLRWANAAFFESTGLNLGDALSALASPSPESSAALAQAIVTAQAPEGELGLRHVGGQPLWVRARISRNAEGLLWTLQDTTTSHALVAEATRLSELLGMAQEFGRLGVWEREIPSGKGRWDHHVFGFWGLPPTEQAPDHALAIAHVHPDDRSTAYADSTRQAGRYAQHYRVIRADGSVRHIHSQWEVKNSPEGVPVRTIGIMMDDTHVHEMARMRDAVAAELRLVTGLADIVIWRHDLRTDRIHYNDHGFKVLGIPHSPDGLTLAEARSYTHPDDVAKLAASSAHALATGVPIDVEVRHRRSDGVWRYILVRRVIERGESGEPLSFVGVSLDVTERHAALAALQTAHERAALIARHAGIGTWETDSEGRLGRWDEQMWRLRGLTPRDAAPGPEERIAIVHPEDRQRLLDNSPYVRTEPAAYEFRVRMPDGRYRWLASRSAALLDERGCLLRRVGVNWGVTEAKNAELARQKALLAERESQAKSQFLSRMSHELRTPLNAVLGFTQLLQFEARHGAEHTHMARLDHIRSAGEHLLTLIDDALDLSGLQTGTLKLGLEPVLLSALVGGAFGELAPLAESHGVRLQVGAVAGSVMADPARLRQVLLNLLTNAVRHNVRGGRVVVATTIEGDDMLIEVRDTGRGMDAEQTARLFEPFSDVSTKGEGAVSLGLGLAIARALVHGMGGTLCAHSELGQGTVFSLRLPRVVEPAPNAAADLAARRDGLVLYIEDNHVNVLLVEELVKSLPGLRVASEGTGTEGVARALETRPDLILIDMHLPDFDGYEVLRRLRANPSTAAIPCIALSANALPDDIAQGLAGGFDDYWTKPIKFKPFLQALERLFPVVSA